MDAFPDPLFVSPDACDGGPMDNEEVRGLCEAALEAMAPLLPPGSYRDAHDLIYRYGEHLLAVEMLVDWSGDLELTLDARQHDALVAAMRALGQSCGARMRWLGEQRPAAG